MKQEIRQACYDSFSCVADKCSFTCCKEWRIAVDEETNLKWKKLKREGDSFPLSSYVYGKKNERSIKLCDDKNCPFLKENLLCELVLEHGEEVLSKTCHEFPRQIHEFEDRVEKSVVSCCPVVVDYFNNSRTIDFIYEGDAKQISYPVKDEIDILYSVRKEMIVFLQREEYDLSTSLKMLYYIMLDIHSKYYGDSEWKFDGKAYFENDVIAELYEAVSNINVDKDEALVERNELFLDLASNYNKQDIYTRLLENLVAQAEKISDSEEMASSYYRKWQEGFNQYDRLFRNFLVSELFTNLIKPQSDVESMTVMLQWIAMEYSVIHHGVFLKCMSGDLGADEQNIPYNTVRDIMVLISRMTGYDEDDIFEYLEQCFESLIWEWGYLALVVDGA